MLINKKIIKNIFFLSLAVIIISLAVGIYLKSTLHIFLGWNVFLAIVPLMLSNYVYNNFGKSKKWIIIVVSIIWLLFFPNSIYILTDFIHLGVVEFYNSPDFYSPNVYIRDIDIWIKLFHIIICSMIGLINGLVSLYLMELSFKNKSNKKYIPLLIAVVIVLSGIAVYIGRFLRFNSWDVFNLWNLVSSFFISLDVFAILFIFLYSIVTLFCYFLFKMLISIKQETEIQE